MSSAHCACYIATYSTFSRYVNMHRTMRTAHVAYVARFNVSRIVQPGDAPGARPRAILTHVDVITNHASCTHCSRIVLASCSNV